MKTLTTSPRMIFFQKLEFYSSLKNEIISNDSYETVKKFWQLLRFTKLFDLKDIYNFQDTIIHREIFENRGTKMMKKFSYNLENVLQQARSAVASIDFCQG